MPTDIREVVDQLRQAFLRQDEAGWTDAQLLGYFIDHRDEAAIAALIRRHGPMVWGVCRRLLGSHHDAEDAFQTTFLVLVRRAATITPRAMVGNWLYGVAHQSARKARAMLAKRRTRERQGTAMPEPQAPEQDTWNDLRAVLDQELSGLPDKYRVAIVLCDLAGKTRKEAARQLGIPEGTLAGRLTRGRAMLAKRLTRHGLALSGGALGAMLTQKASASVPAAVMSSAVQAVTAVAAGKAAAVVCSGTVTALTERVLTTMFLNRLLKMATTVFLLTLLGLGGGAYLRETAAAQQPPVKKRLDQPGSAVPQTPVTDRRPDPGRLKLWMTLRGHGKGVHALAVSPDGRLLASGSDDASIKIWDLRTGKAIKTLSGHEGVVGALAFSRDGKALASAGMRIGADFEEKVPAAVKLWDVATWQEKVELQDNEGRFRRLALSPDGKVLAACDGADRVKLWDTATGKPLGTIKEEDRRLIHTLVFSPDGKTLILGTNGPPGEDPIRLWDWAEPKANGSLKLDGECRDLHFTHDGKTLVMLNQYGEITFWDYATARERNTVRATVEQNWPGYPLAFALSADGKRVALGYATLTQGRQYGGKVEVRDTRTGDLVTQVELDMAVRCMAFLPGGAKLAAGSLKGAHRERAPNAIWLQGEEGVVSIWELQAGKE